MRRRRESGERGGARSSSSPSPSPARRQRRRRGANPGGGLERRAQRLRGPRRPRGRPRRQKRRRARRRRQPPRRPSRPRGQAPARLGLDEAPPSRADAEPAVAPPVARGNAAGPGATARPGRHGERRHQGDGLLFRVEDAAGVGGRGEGDEGAAGAEPDRGPVGERRRGGRKRGRRRSVASFVPSFPSPFLSVPPPGDVGPEPRWNVPLRDPCSRQTRGRTRRAKRDVQRQEVGLGPRRHERRRRRRQGRDLEYGRRGAAEAGLFPALLRGLAIFRRLFFFFQVLADELGGSEAMPLREVVLECGDEPVLRFWIFGFFLEKQEG